MPIVGRYSTTFNHEFSSANLSGPTPRNSGTCHSTDPVVPLHPRREKGSLCGGISLHPLELKGHAFVFFDRLTSQSLLGQNIFKHSYVTWPLFQSPSPTPRVFGTSRSVLCWILGKPARSCLLGLAWTSPYWTWLCGVHWGLKARSFPVRVDSTVEVTPTQVPPIRREFQKIKFGSSVLYRAPAWTIRWCRTLFFFQTLQ